MNRYRTGMGLMLALVAVVLVTSLLATAILLCVDGRRRAHAAAGEGQHLVLLRDTEATVATYLAAHGRTLVTPPEAWGLPLIDDTGATWHGRPVRIRVQLYGTAGGLPAQLAGSNRSLAGIRPPLFADAVIPPAPAGTPATATDLLWRIALPGGRRRFPPPLPIATSDHAATDPALAEWLMPHADTQVNVNTTPLSLLGRILSLAPHPAAESILQDRRAGRRVVLDGASRVRGEVDWVDEAIGWQAHIVIAIGSEIRAWWVVFAATDDGVAEVMRHGC